MLRSLNSLLDSSVHAKDGEIGHLADILLDDRSWVVRYLVVDTGRWLSGRKVLLSPVAARTPELEDGGLHVDLTMEQVRTSPGTETDLPVSRQEEIAMTIHYGWPAYWSPESRPLAADTGTAAAAEGNPNLRSSKAISNYEVKSSDGDLGHLTDLILEDANWFVRFLVVTTGSWFKHRQLLIGTRWVGEISWSDREIRLPHSGHYL